MTNDDSTRRAAIAMLSEGLASPAEIARLAGHSRQLIRKWLLADGVDWRKQRGRVLAELWKAAYHD